MMAGMKRVDMLSSSPVSPRPRIAVVDDDQAFLDLMHELLVDAGWDTILCSDGHRALETINMENPDAIVLDIHIHRADAGWNILTYLLLHPTLHRIPVVICSAAQRDIEDRAAWLQEHEVAILHKPFDLDDLYLAINSALARSTAGRNGVVATA